MAALDTISSTMIAEVAVQIVLQKLDVLLSHPVYVGCLSMQSCVRDAKANLATVLEFISTQDRPPQTTEWPGRLLQAMNYAEEFIDKFYLREARERHEALRMAARPLAALVSKYKLWRGLSKLVHMTEMLCDEKFLKDLAERKRKNESAGSSSHAVVPWKGTKLARLTSFWDQYEPIFSFYLNDKKEELMTRIRRQKKEGIQGTSILGGRGTGTTMLARWVHSQAGYAGYEMRAWVHISDGMEKREFLFKILKQVERRAREMKDMEIWEIKTMLNRKLAETKRFLVVLDEVKPSNEPLLRELMMIIPINSRGHIICATEDGNIARNMNTTDKGPITLQDIPQGEAQNMLAWKLYRVHDGKRLSEEESNILKRCPPLPRQISLLGGFLKTAGQHERAALAKEGSKMTFSDLERLSCHKLPVHLKPCFIYMALFPVAFPIPTRRLVRLWLAEGLLDGHCYHIERERTGQPEDVGEMFILELADRNVIDVVRRRADGSPKACHMIVDLHKMIWPIAMSMGFLHIHAAPKSKGGNDHDATSQQQQQQPAQPQERNMIRWLAEHTNIVPNVGGGSYPNISLRHVRSFVSFHLRRGVLTKDINTILGKMTSETDYSLLRVLDLEGVYKPSLQVVLRKLVLLRYLGLRSTVLDSLPSAVADLHHLQTLDIKHTSITSLPNSLWKARNLRHLHLNWFYIDLNTILKACSNNVTALVQLQTLSGLVIGEVKESPMTGLMNGLTTLTTLKLFLQHSGKDPTGAAGKTVADWISFRLTHLQSLTFGVIQEPKPVEEAQTAKEAELAKEAHPPEEAKPAEKAMKVAKPTTSQIGPLPELSLAERHHDLLELYLLGQITKPSWKQLLPVSLRVLTLSGSKVKTDMLPELSGLLRNLRTFRLLANSFLGTALTFVKDGFPSLKILKIWRLPHLQEVVIEKGAMLQLQELEFRHLDAMKNVTGIKECNKLKKICVVTKKGAQDLVRCLKEQKGETTNLYIIGKIQAPESRDDDEDDINRTGKEDEFELPIEGDPPKVPESRDANEYDIDRTVNEEEMIPIERDPKSSESTDDDRSEDYQDALPSTSHCNILRS